MLERLLKSTKNAEQTNANRSLKRPREETTTVDSLPISNQKPTNGIEKSAAFKTEPQTPNVTLNEANDFPDDDIIMSMLDDDQFDEHLADLPATNGTAIKTEEIKIEQIKAEQMKAEQIKAELVKKENETYAKLLSNWENVENDDDDELLGSVDVDAAQASVTNSMDGKSSLKFWYWDAFEDPIKLPGKVFLFGKMVSDKNPNEFKSVCVTVEKVYRCLYFLPRKFVSLTFLWSHNKLFELSLTSFIRRF